MVAISNHRKKIKLWFPPQLRHFFESKVIKKCPEYESPSGLHNQPTACYDQSDWVYITSVEISFDKHELAYSSVVNHWFSRNAVRIHKSNNMYFQITPSTFTFRQKCYDTESHGATAQALQFQSVFFKGARIKQTFHFAFYIYFICSHLFKWFRGQTCSIFYFFEVSTQTNKKKILILDERILIMHRDGS